ncbi:hypothetical protein [Cupriavidus sp. BIC8F]|uniref:hypothetical protein n=1 Tax=Cupriavidus sp. BIC8F TaxID=3079014 RepID=UPI002915CDAE|nr:hypothetical protein [Cupriavidus sp. BIC8F]
MASVSTAAVFSFVTQIECIPLPGLQVVPVDEPLLSIDYSLCCLEVRKERPLIAALFAVALG